MPENTKEKAQPRRRGKPIEVWVTDDEKATITERAEEAGMSRSGYLRALGLNTRNKVGRSTLLRLRTWPRSTATLGGSLGC